MTGRHHLHTRWHSARLWLLHAFIGAGAIAFTLYAWVGAFLFFFGGAR